MTRHARSQVVLEARGLHVDSPGGRPLARDLELQIKDDKVAMVGRNGCGKSTLLAVLAGHDKPSRGTVRFASEPLLVPQSVGNGAAVARALSTVAGRSSAPQELAAAGLPELRELTSREALSAGEIRKVLLLDAKLQGSGLLLLDEPTEDLDAHGVRWLCQWLAQWQGSAVVVTHNRRLLRGFEHFFVVQESGCRVVSGTFDELLREMEHQAAQAQRAYLSNIAVLEERERHNARVCNRRQRKKNLGRIHEAGRTPSRAKLNENRSYAQVSQGRAARLRRERINAVRSWAKAARRALAVELPLHLEVPVLPHDDGKPIVELAAVTVERGGRKLAQDLHLSVGRDRVAIVGPNGSGKTTLVEVILGLRSPTAGKSSRDDRRIGAIAQGATDWMSADSLLTHLMTMSSRASPQELAELVLAHKFPLALAERPLASLSPGERTRAALICLFERQPAPELIVLDEPTFALDFVGAAAVERALAAWPGGLTVVSHDEELLEAIRVEQILDLGQPDVALRASCAEPHPWPP